MSTPGRGGRDGQSRASKRAPKPEKLCAACGRPFQWRRKWAACWDEVKYCSDRCRTRGARA